MVERRELAVLPALGLWQLTRKREWGLAAGLFSSLIFESGFGIPAGGDV